MAAYWGDLCDNPEPHVGHDYEFEGRTVLCEGRLTDARQPGETQLTEFQKRVVGILGGSHDTYMERSAVYKDNFRAVGRVMEALFPEGRPGLKVAADYDRWHIFELLIVKLTRYANNYDDPHEDSLLDMLPYEGILGGLDQELRERRQPTKAGNGRKLTDGPGVGRDGDELGQEKRAIRGEDALVDAHGLADRYDMGFVD